MVMRRFEIVEKYYAEGLGEAKIPERSTAKSAGYDFFNPASPTPQFKSINSSVLSLPHSPNLTYKYDHRKNHSLD